MIVLPQADGWQVIYHRAHALLAAQIAAAWQPELRPARWIETLAAITHHDDLVREWEQNQLSAAGGPLDFTLDTDFAVERLGTLVTGARYRGLWVALLVSMHLSFVQEVRRGLHAELDQLLDQQRVWQEEWRQALGVGKCEAEYAYAFMQWCDRLSLILCQQVIPDRERALEISLGPDQRRYDLRQRADKTLVVDPWPFASRRFSVEVEAWSLKQLAFANNAALTAALQAAPRTLLRWEFVQASSD